MLWKLRVLILKIVVILFLQSCHSFNLHIASEVNERSYGLWTCCLKLWKLFLRLAVIVTQQGSNIWRLKYFPCEAVLADWHALLFEIILWFSSYLLWLFWVLCDLQRNVLPWFAFTNISVSWCLVLFLWTQALALLFEYSKSLSQTIAWLKDWNVVSVFLAIDLGMGLIWRDYFPQFVCFSS